MRPLSTTAHYYQQFDADFSLDVPAEGYGGWKTSEIDLDLDHTAVVVMHAWDCGNREQYPGWHRAVEYIPRANSICHNVIRNLLTVVREKRLTLFHVVSGGDYYKHLPGYQKALALAGPTSPPPEHIASDPSLENLHRFRAENVFVGPHNAQDVQRGFANLRIHPDATPVGDEGVAENAHQLFALAKDSGVNHLIYAGFAINWCLLLSPGGMAEMSARGFMCSAFREAVTAVENKETARTELCKEIALWRVALAFGFAFNVESFCDALKGI